MIATEITRRKIIFYSWQPYMHNSTFVSLIYANGHVNKLPNPILTLPTDKPAIVWTLGGQSINIMKYLL